MTTMVGPILRPDDHYLLRYYAAINRVVHCVMHRVFSLLRPHNGMTIREHLFDINGYSNTKYRKNFNDSERSKLDNNEPSESFDITFLYKLLQLICSLPATNTARWSDPGSLENSLKRLKDHRNVLAHENISLTSNELGEKIKDLEELCRNVLVAAGLRRRALVIADIAKMEKEMEEVLLGGIDLWEPYKDALNKLRREQTSVLLREGNKDIKILSKNLRILYPFAWLLDPKYSHLDVKHIFTEMEIKNENRIEMREILTTTLPSSELPDTIIISGPPGIGKSSLIRFLIHDWLSANPTVLGMENIDLVLPVELRHVCSHDIKDLVKDEILCSVSKHLETDDVMSSLNSISLLWLLDGYDEANLETKKMMKGIFRKFPNSRVLVTTRTEFRNEIELSLNQVHRCLLSVDLIGFSKHNIELCAKKLIEVSVKDISERSSVLKKFMKFSQDENLLQLEIFSVPLFVTIIVILWLDTPDKLSFVKTRSALYKLLIEHIINRLMVRDSYIQLNQRKFVLERKVNKFLYCLGKILWKKTDYNLHQYEVNCLEEICFELRLPFVDTMSAFFTCTEKATPTGVTEKYMVIHRTTMDFLIARAFCDKMILENWDVMTTAENWFKSARETLLQHKPQEFYSRQMFNVDNLTKDMPCAINPSFREIRFVMPNENYFISRTQCNTCDTAKLRNLCRCKCKRCLWCHIRDHTGGPWILYLTGYLNLRQELTEERCEQLAFIFFTDMTSRNFSSWALFVKEAENEMFNEKLFKYAANFTWFCDHKFIGGTKELLRYVIPKSVFIHYCHPFRERNNYPIENLISFVKIFMEYPLDLHLDLRHFLSIPNPGIGFTKTCLDLLLDSSSRCRLVSVRCPVNIDIVRLLKSAIHLRELTVRVYNEDFSEFGELVHSLPDLEAVNVALHPSRNSSLELPVLIPGSESLFKASVVLTDVFHLDPQHVGSVVRRLCSSPSHVVLQGHIIRIDLGNLLTYIFWVLNIGSVRKLEMILEIPSFIFGIEAIKLKPLILFTKRVFHGTTIEIKFSLDGYIHTLH